MCAVDARITVVSRAGFSIQMKRQTLICLILLQWFYGPQDADAEGLLEWLFQRRVIYVQPWSVYHAPPRENRPESAVVPNPLIGQRVVVNYAPTTYYKTIWKRQPVTYYRPVSGVDPVSFSPTTVLRPCTSHRWKLSRVPFSCFRPVYSRRVYQANFPNAPIISMPGAASSCSTCPTNSLGQGGNVGDAVTRGVPVLADPLERAPRGTGSAAADTRPSLNNLKLDTRLRGAISGQGTLGATSGTATQKQRKLKPLSPTPSVGTRAKSEKQADAAKPPIETKALRPIPDPDDRRSIIDGSRIPQLLTPQDKSARSHSLLWPAARISWAKPPSGTGSAFRAAVHRVVAPVIVTREKRWEDDGWRAVER